jgi:transcriptional regulator with XRE-family HTH domain
MTTIHEQLRDRRLGLGWGVYRLAQAIGVHNNQVVQWESGARRPRLDALTAWAAALGYELTLAPMPGVELVAEVLPARSTEWLPEDELDRLRGLRVLAGLTQDDVAAAIGTTRRTVRHWESGRHRPSPEHQRAWHPGSAGVA